MKPSVVIPCWVNDEEVWQATNACIESFRASGDVELIIIDNGSKVGGGYLREMADLYLRYPKNLGYTVAINDGIKLANGEMIALANNDIRVAPNWIEVCQEILKDESVGTVHPKMTDYDVPFAYGDLVAKTGRERWCQNSFVATLHHDFFFDEHYGIGGGADDWDFYFTLRANGYSTCYTNKTCFQHLHSFSLKKLGRERDLVREQNLKYFKDTWGKSPEELFAEQFPEQLKEDWKGGFI